MLTCKQKTFLMEKLLQIISRKQPEFHTISCTASVSDALCKMSCENSDYLVVTDENDRFAGIISEHDITSKLVYLSQSLELVPVKFIMNNQLPHASSGDSIESCMQMMQRHQVRYVPVFEGFSFRGVVTGDDILQEAVYNRQEIFDMANERTRVSIW